MVGSPLFYLKILIGSFSKSANDKKYINVVARYSFSFSSSRIMSSHNKSILRHSMAACLLSIIVGKHINVGAIIRKEMTMRDK